MLYNTLTTLALALLTNPNTASSSPPRDQQPIYPPTSSNKPLSIPPIGLGLWNASPKDASRAVTTALSTNYTHLDCAAAYNNEAAVGTALSTLPNHRSSYWLTSKLWNTAHRPSLVSHALNQTLHDLNTTYLDLYLMHWPVAFVPDTKPGRTVIDQDVTLLDTWRAMEDLVRANLTRYIGVSNFSPRQLDVILAKCDICPFAHEFETHPYLQQQEFVEWHHKRDIKVIAYSPLGNLNPTYNGTHKELPRLTEDPFWVEVAAGKNVTVAQAVLGWNLQRGVVVIPKSVHEKRIRENFGAGEVRFEREEMVRVLEQDRRARFNDPGKGWGVELFEGLDGGTNRFLGWEELEEL